MKLHELTREQQDFAAEHHHLVYAFLYEKNLRRDDYYDVVIFGYLLAVQKYLLRSDLQLQYAFSTIAWRAMECSIGNYFRSQTRPSRKAVTVSMDAAAYSDGGLTIAELIPSQDRLMEQLEAKLLWDEISSSLTEVQVETLRLFADGFSAREIAAVRESPVREVEDFLTSTLRSAHELCWA